MYYNVNNIISNSSIKRIITECCLIIDQDYKIIWHRFIYKIQHYAQYQ